MTHIRYEAATLDTIPADRTFDAVVGRYVLCFQPDRGAFLRQAAARVRRGGSLAFMEPGAPEPVLPDTTIHERWSYPPVALFDEIRDLCLIAFKLAGARVHTGAILAPLFHEAGLSEPELMQDVPTGGPSSPIVELIYHLFASLLPVLEQHRITDASKIGLDTLQARMQAAASEAHSQLRLYNIIGAWTTIE